MLKELFDSGKALCEKENIPVHLVKCEFSMKLELGYDLDGNIVATLEETEPGLNTTPLEKVRTSDAYAFLFNEYPEPGSVGETKSVIKSRLLASYIEKHKALIPESDELFHAWLDSGCLARYNCKPRKGMFELVIDGTRAVDQYDSIVLQNVHEQVATKTGHGLWSDGRLVDKASKVRAGSESNSLISYNSNMYLNNRPRCVLTLEENSYIKRGWDEMFKNVKFLGKSGKDSRYAGGIGIDPKDAFSASFEDNSNEILEKYRNAEVASNTKLGNVSIIFFKVPRGRFEHELMVQEDASDLFKNIAKFRSDCGDYSEALSRIVVTHYPSGDSGKQKVEYLEKTPTLLQSIFLNRPITESDISPVGAGLLGYRHIKDPYLFVQIFKGALGLARCYILRKGIKMENYMYKVGKIMAILHKKQNWVHRKHKVGGENVIWDLVKNLDRPEQMLGTALEKMKSYWDADKTGPDLYVFKLISELPDDGSKSLHLVDKKMCFFLGFAEGLNYNNSNNSNSNENEGN